jgi:hypothetical protein
MEDCLALPQAGMARAFGASGLNSYHNNCIDCLGNWALGLHHAPISSGRFRFWPGNDNFRLVGRILAGFVLVDGEESVFKSPQNCSLGFFLIGKTSTKCLC